MITIPHWLKVQFFVFLSIVVLVLGFLVFRTGDLRTAQQAEEYYRQGETAQTIFARKQAFNKALDLFLRLDADYHPHFGTGRLQYNIANTYFQLGEYPLSILYYKRAENLMPRSQPVKRNLSQAYTKAGSKMAEKHLGLFDLFLLKPFLSLPERIQIFFVLASLTLGLISAWLWTRKSWLSKTATTFLALTFIFFLNLGISYYFSPVEAVLVHAAEMRRDAGMEFAQVGDGPVLGGTTVEVLGTSPNGKWLRVVVPGGDFGFLPSEAVKLIDL
jgi:hypothetical protein